MDDKGNKVKDEKKNPVLIRTRTQILKVKKSAQPDVKCPEEACKGKRFSWSCPKARKNHYENYHPKKKKNGKFTYKEIECPLCGKQVSGIWKHVREVHKQFQTEETCMVCRVSIKGKSKMKEHYDEKHKDNKCEGCLRQFKTQEDAQRHQCGETTGVFVCPACKKEFNDDESNENGNDPQGHKCPKKKVFKEPAKQEKNSKKRKPENGNDPQHHVCRNTSKVSRR